MPVKSINLRLKFIIGLVLSVTALGICISIIMYFHYNSIMQSEISQRSRMLLAQSDAVQDYVKTELRPQMFESLPKGRFILKAMSSSYISREIMARLNLKDAARYHYRRVSRNPRNPSSAPDEFESKLIRRFSQNSTLDIWEETTRVGEDDYHLVARPVTFSQSCMNCHGDPADAPAELIESYGNKNGFHYTPGEVGGVVVAGFPVDMIKRPARDLTFNYLSLYLLGIFFFAGMISLFFDRLVMRNLHELSRIFKTRFSGEAEQRIIQKLEQKDEIEGLIEGVDELALCLSDARKELETYTGNLEQMVEDRTLELDRKAKKHLGDVRLFVDLLTGFGGAMTTRQLVSALLRSVGRRYGASDVIYYCTVVSGESFGWQSETEVPPLPPSTRDLLWKNDVLFEDQGLYVPVKSQESHWGILLITWDEPPDKERLEPDVLLALGQQVAILIENIHAVSNLRAQHDMLQSIFEGISDPLLLIDQDCRILIGNSGSREILGNDSRQDRQQVLKQMLCSDSPAPDMCSILSRVVESGRPVSEEIHTHDNRFIAMDLYPLPKQDPSRLKIVVYAREITAEKKMMERMQQAERLGAIGKLAAGIAHEINNPLGVIQCYTDLVRDAVTDPAALTDIDVIDKHTRTAQKVVQDLLSLSRAKKAVSGSCDLNQVVDQSLQVFNAQAVSRDIRVVTRLDRDLPRINCDTAVLEQILTNLWLNAVDAIGESGDTITIETGMAEAGEAVLSLSDNGPGIPKSIRHRIFDPFYTTKDVGTGTGLGLSIVYGFVSEFGGRIQLDNTRETRFNVYFPVVPEG